MSPFRRLRSVRATLAAGVFARALGWGIAASLTLVLAGAIVDQHAGISLGLRYLLLVIAAATLVGVTGALLWRDRAVTALERVALWIEEREPGLEYRLVTAVEARRESLVPAAGSERWLATARARALRAIAVPVAVA